MPVVAAWAALICLTVLTGSLERNLVNQCSLRYGDEVSIWGDGKAEPSSAIFLEHVPIDDDAVNIYSYAISSEYSSYFFFRIYRGSGRLTQSRTVGRDCTTRSPGRVEWREGPFFRERIGKDFDSGGISHLIRGRLSMIGNRVLDFQSLVNVEPVQIERYRSQVSSQLRFGRFFHMPQLQLSRTPQIISGPLQCKREACDCDCRKSGEDRATRSDEVADTSRRRLALQGWMFVIGFPFLIGYLVWEWFQSPYNRRRGDPDSPRGEQRDRKRTDL